MTTTIKGFNSDYRHAEWMSLGRCQEEDFSSLEFVPDNPPSDDQEIAAFQMACRNCPVATECFDRAERGKLEGVWGGYYFPFGWWRDRPDLSIVLLETKQQKIAGWTINDRGIPRTKNLLDTAENAYRMCAEGQASQRAEEV